VCVCVRVRACPGRCRSVRGGLGRRKRAKDSRDDRSVGAKNASHVQSIVTSTTAGFGLHCLPSAAVLSAAAAAAVVVVAAMHSCYIVLFRRLGHGRPGVYIYAYHACTATATVYSPVDNRPAALSSHTRTHTHTHTHTYIHTYDLI